MTVPPAAVDLVMLTMYSTTWCGYCRRLKLQLEQAGLSYREVDIERDDDAARFVENVNGGTHIVRAGFADYSAAAQLSSMLRAMLTLPGRRSGASVAPQSPARRATRRSARVTHIASAISPSAGE